ncbi:AAA family ATPase [Pseudomonas moraviensis]|uniref:Energy-coupling factor transporter ATP-binding protein EcfA2 n=1 Tax=Pseudomonas moraviensis TaxID=321662 RepID=A0A7Z0ATK6_9PSED|nr:AAA family ATPase [Pseudomonas moraviensis]NYH08242.1 energy-coupling factor transporter ATP-binding protein EcfA2 [Pseudomonas moraviensis]
MYIRKATSDQNGVTWEHVEVHIDRVMFVGFQSPLRTAEVFFSKDSASVIYGDNGCGKTTFLKLLHAFLSKDSSAFKKEGVVRAELDYSVNSSELHKVVVGKIPMEDYNVSDEPPEVKYDWSQVEGSLIERTSSLSLGVERGVTTLATRIEVSDIIRYMNNYPVREMPRHRMSEFAEGLALHLRRYQSVRQRNSRDEFDLDDKNVYLQNIKMSNIENLLLERYRVARNIATTKIQNALFDTLAVAIEQSEQGGTTFKAMPENFGESVLKSKERIIEALKDGTENNFKSRIISVLEDFKRKEDVAQLTQNRILCQLIINMITELQIEKQLLSAINVLVDTFNEFLIEGKELRITKDELVVDVGGSHHSIDVLSSGERHILTFLSLIVVSGRNKDFIIIDEPEISLNMKWQRSLMELLKRLAPDTQIIVASHSPAIAKRHPMSLVELKPQLSMEPAYV